MSFYLLIGDPWKPYKAGPNSAGRGLYTFEECYTERRISVSNFHHCYSMKHIEKLIKGHGSGYLLRILCVINLDRNGVVFKITPAAYMYF